MKLGDGVARDSRGSAADAESTGRPWASKPTKNQLQQMMIRIDRLGDQQFLCLLHCVNKCWPYVRTCDLARDDSARLVKRPTLRSCVRQSIDGESAEKTSRIRRERFKRPSGKIHWSSRSIWQVSRESMRLSSHAAGRCCGTRSPWKSSVGHSTGDCLLQDGTALSLRGKPFSLHLLNESGAVHMEQLSRLARNPIGLSKRANDQTVLELFDLS